jgi:SAM-dependent methyltransferase
MDPGAAIPLGLAAVPKRQAGEASELAVYDQTLRESRAERNRELVGTILASEGEMRRAVEEEAAAFTAAGSTQPRGAWRWVEGACYWLNTETGARSWKAPDEAGAADSPAGAADPPSARQISHPPSPSGPLRGLAPAGPRQISHPPNPAPLASRPDAEVARVQSVAEAYGYAAALASTEDRDRALTIELRRANNFLKDGPIRVCLSFWAHVLAAGRRAGPLPPGTDPRAHAAPRLEVLDLCCGRGQDFDKYRRACRDSFAVLAKLVGVDVAGREASASARERWAQVADRVLSDTREAGTAVLMGGVLTADLAALHAARAIDEAAERARFDADSVPATGSAHLACCYFALHYFFRSEAALRNLLAGASWLLRDGGFFAAIHADGEAIASAFAAAGGLQRTFRVGHATITLHEATAAMLRDAEGSPAAEPPSPFGWAYDFHLPNAVEHVTEYLVHSPARDRTAEAMHLVKILDEPADGLLARMVTVPFWRDAYDKCEVDTRRAGALAPETLDGLALYRVVIYAKSPLRADVHAVRRFVRAKLGFGE